MADHSARYLKSTRAGRNDAGPAPGRQRTRPAAAIDAGRQALPSGHAQPLPRALAGEMGRRFGEDFSQVLLHDDAEARASAEALQARAYTFGEHIVLGHSAPPADSHEGKRTLAHELAHVVQQRRGGPPPALTPNAPHEVAAERAASAAVSGTGAVPVGGATGVGVARDLDEDEEALRKRNEAKRPLKGVPPEVDKAVESSIVEEKTPQPDPKSVKTRKVPSTQEAKDTRTNFRKVRNSYATALGVGAGGQVHHGVEVQAMKRYPGVFSQAEINAAENARGIRPEQGGKRQLHNRAIRATWDRHYNKLDELIKQKGLKKNTPQYAKFVREYLLDARAEMDHLYDKLYSEARLDKTAKDGKAAAKPKAKAKAKTKTKSTAKPKAKTKAKTKATSKPKTTSQSKAKTKAASKPDAKTKVASKPDAKTKAASKPDAKTKAASKPDAKTKAASKPDAKTKAASKPDAKTKATPKTTPQAKAKKAASPSAATAKKPSTKASTKRPAAPPKSTKTPSTPATTGKPTRTTRTTPPAKTAVTTTTPTTTPGTKPGKPPTTGSGAKGVGVNLLGVGVQLLAGWIHSKAVEKRIEQKANDKGWVPYGAPSGEGMLYDLGAWFMDPSNEADRAVDFKKRFQISPWRQKIRDAANAKKPGEKLNFDWQVGICKTDALGRWKTVTHKAVYLKNADGRWSKEGGELWGMPMMNDIISEEVPDSQIEKYIYADPCYQADRDYTKGST